METARLQLMKLREARGIRKYPCVYVQIISILIGSSSSSYSQELCDSTRVYIR
jgi:hypothetical protein